MYINVSPALKSYHDLVLHGGCEELCLLKQLHVFIIPLEVGGDQMSFPPQHFCPNQTYFPEWAL